MTPSAIFGLWRSAPKFTREQVRVVCPAFNDFRRKLNRLASILIDRESDDAKRIAEELIRIRWQMESQPIPFDNAVMEKITSLAGGSATLQMRWGDEPSVQHDDLVKAGEALQRSGNAISQVLASRTGQLDGDTGIWCHRTVSGAFAEHVGTDFQFLHSNPGYRSSSVFDNLVTLGGLRRFGIGHLPESVLLAPRFRHLLQIMWSSDKDDPEFGQSACALGFDFRAAWEITVREVECGHPDCNGLEQIDEIDANADVLTEWAAKRESKRRLVRNAALLALGGGKGLMLRSGSRAMIFDPVNGGVIEKDAEKVEEGDVLIRYEGEIDFGEIAAQDHELVRKWRNDLRYAYDKDADDLLSSLKRNGVGLKGLANCVVYWMDNRRPQQQANLERVCETLGWSRSSTKKLWRVFSEQHGEAIQTGSAGKEVEREEIEKWIGNSEIRDVLAQLPDSRMGQESFDIQIAGDSLLITAHVVDHVDHHMHGDENRMDKILSLKEFDQ